jgi:DNA-binding Lrp family transcriptional regulator
LDGTHPPTLDAVDRRILWELSRDPRASNRALAREIDMSAGAVRERVERLQQQGVIRGYTLDVDPAAIGLGLEALLGLQLTQHQSLIETMEALAKLPEVVAIDMVTGRWDLVVRVRVRDHQQLKDALSGVWAMPSVRHSESMVVLDSYRNDRLSNEMTLP